MDRIQWTKNKCIIEAKKYKTISSWQKASPSSYKASIRLNCKKQCSSHMTPTSQLLSEMNKKYTLSMCLQVAKKYKTRTEWFKGDTGSYNAARRNGWEKQCSKHMIYLCFKNYKYTLKECKLIALKYKTKTEFMKKDFRFYSHCRRKKWLTKCCAHMERNPLSYLKNEALKFSSRIEWCRKSYASYQIACRRNLVNKLSKHMIRPSNGSKRIVYAYFDYKQNYCYVGLTGNPQERFNTHLRDNKNFKISLSKGNLTYIEMTDFINQSDAQKIEDHFVNHFKNCGFKILNKSKTGSLGGNNLIWTKEKCINESKKYKTRTEWFQKAQASWHSAKKYGVFNKCVRHMKKVNSWTNEEIIKRSKKYKTSGEFYKKDPTAYKQASHRHLLNYCFKNKTKSHRLLIEN